MDIDDNDNNDNNDDDDDDILTDDALSKLEKEKKRNLSKNRFIF